MSTAPLHQFVTPLLPVHMRLQTGYMDNNRVARYKIKGRHFETSLVFTDPGLGFKVQIEVYRNHTACCVAFAEFDCRLASLRAAVDDGMKYVLAVAQKAVADDLGFNTSGVLA